MKYYLGIKTDSSLAELILANDSDYYEFSWRADRKMAQDLLKNIEAFLHSKNLSWSSIAGVAVFLGPGSFTGLRIGCTVANTIAYSNNIPVVGAKTAGWFEISRTKLKNIKSGMALEYVTPDYEREARTTQPRK